MLMPAFLYAIIIILGSYVRIATPEWKCTLGPGDIISLRGLSSAIADAAYKVTPEKCILKIAVIRSLVKPQWVKPKSLSFVISN